MKRHRLIPWLAAVPLAVLSSAAAGLCLNTPPTSEETAASTDAAAIRREIDSVLTAMTAAAIAGDPATFLSHVAPAPTGPDPDADPGHAAARFRKEQENWAADLAEHKPLEFSLAIGTKPFDVTDTRATFELVLTYKMAVGAATRPTRAAWPAVFERTTGPDRRATWLYAGEDWRTIGGLTQDGGSFIIRFFPGDEPVAADVLKAFPAAKAHDDEGFGIVNTTPQTIKLFRNMEHLKATVYLSMPDRVLGGWNEPGESIKFMSTYTRGVKGWTGAFAHEYGHVATWELGPKAGDIVWWVQEGVAELAAADLVPGYHQATDRLIRSLAARDDLAPWDQIADYRAAPASRKHLAYRQGYHLMAYITTRWERAGRNAWLRRQAAGESADEATRGQFGMSFAELDAAWRSQFATPTAPPAKDEATPEHATPPPAPAPGP